MSISIIIATGNIVEYLTPLEMNLSLDICFDLQFFELFFGDDGQTVFRVS